MLIYKDPSKHPNAVMSTSG